RIAPNSPCRAANGRPVGSRCSYRSGWNRLSGFRHGEILQLLYMTSRDQGRIGSARPPHPHCRLLMKTLFLGSFGARPGVWEAILAKTTEKLEVSVLFDIDDTQRLMPALAEAEIVVSHVWNKDFPDAPSIRLLQSVAAGIDLIDVPSMPHGVTV